MQINAIISLIKSNTFDEAKALLDKTRKQPHLANSEKFQSIFRGLQVFFLIKDKKVDEALKLINTDDVYSVLLKAQLLLNSKRQKECVIELISHLSRNESSNNLVPLVFRLASNYKLVDIAEF